LSAYLPHRARLRTLLGLADALGYLAALWLAHLLRFTAELRGDKWERLFDLGWLPILAYLSGILFLVAAELYEPEILYRRVELALRCLVALAAWAAALALLTYLYPPWDLGRGVLALTASCWAVFSIGSRWLLTSWMRSRSRFTALVIGDPAAAASFCKALKARPSSPWLAIDGSGVGSAEIADEIKRHDISLVVLAGGYEKSLEMGHELAHLHFSGVPVVASTEIWAWLEERLPLEGLTPAIFLHQPGFGAVHWTLFNRVTRIADVFLAAAMLLASLPLLLPAALAVFVSSGRPIFFSQERLGQFGRSFVMLKLRTMRLDAESAGPAFAAEKDPRATPLGAILRRFRIDELPQLWNVLKGDMSLVGPRPERPEFVTQLTEKIPFYAFRMAVPPGLTGWAQVNISYASTLEDHRRKLEFDLYFIRERSVRLYVMTLLRTLSAALVGPRG
jgi:exopolysaccharide biosynthesis polyprenyl glycosylphosphotransferase